MSAAEKYLANVYKYVTHYFRYVDREALFADSEINMSFGAKIAKIHNIHKINTFSKFYLLSYKHVPIDNKHTITAMYPLLGGLYFPNNNIGDKIKIVISRYRVGDSEDCVFNIKDQSPASFSRFATRHGVARDGTSLMFNITITDIHKIYLPIDDEQFMHVNNIPYSICIIHTNQPFYSVYINCFGDYPYNSLIRLGCENVFYLHKKQQYLDYGDGYCKLNDNPNGHSVIYPNSGSALTIQNAWSGYKDRQKPFYNKWTDFIKKVNIEIRLLPSIGIEYIEAHQRFSKNAYLLSGDDRNSFL